jgi:cysteine desulfurase
MPEEARRIYLDYAATTPVDPRVAAVVMEYMTTSFGNASSADHEFGDDAARAVEEAAVEVGMLVGAPSSDVVFTSGATESINLVLHGLVATSPRPLRVVVSPTEHAAVLDTCRMLARERKIVIQWLTVDAYGRVNLDEIDAACSMGADLLCVMAANNEVGTLTPVPRVAAVAARHGVAYLCDATQACGRVPLHVTDDDITFLALSAHKMHGPKGVGALVSRGTRRLRPMIYGGAQQHGIRAGTLNVPGIAGLGTACRLRRLEMDADEPVIAARRNRMQQRLCEEVSDLIVNGDPIARLSGNLHLSFTGVPNGAVVARVRSRLAVSTGAACSSGIESPSHVLRAMGLSTRALDGAIRVGLGKWTTDEEVDEAVGLLASAAREAAATLAGRS